LGWFSRNLRAVVSDLSEHIEGTQILSEANFVQAPFALIPANLAVVQVLPAPERVTIVTQPQSATATCPECGTISCRIHSVIFQSRLQR